MSVHTAGLVIDMDWVELNGNVRIYDADGVEITKCLRAELYTGKVTRYRTDSDGLPMLSKNRKAVIIEHVGFKPPLRYELIEEKGES